MPQKKRSDRAFSGSARSDQGDGGSRFNFQREIYQNGNVPPSGIAELDIFEPADEKRRVWIYLVPPAIISVKRIYLIRPSIFFGVDPRTE